MTSTATRIWCPDWCTVTENRHLADLGNLDGEVIHSSDSTGTAGAVTDEYALSAIGSPDGALYPELPTHATVMLIADNGEMVHPDDLERHALILLDLVTRARGAQQERQR